MTEPTIDEMLECLKAVELSAKANPPAGFKQEFLDAAWSEAETMLNAIRAILEQVRASEVLTGTIAEWLVEKRRIELEAIRAFVDRVEKRPLSAAADFQDGVYDELAAMSKEAGGVDERDR